MSISNQFSLPYGGMKDGLHRYKFDIDNDFFSSFENTLIRQGNFVIEVEIDKRPSMSEMLLNISGSFATTCDRCLADIHLPVSGQYQLLVKTGDKESEEEIIYISSDQTHLDLKQIFYEFICISLPMVNTYNCENEIPKKCNDEILSKLTTSALTVENIETTSNIWESLKDKLPKGKE
ncbi:MAG: YceD family protein [Saprospiraceae bacterium]